MSSVTAVAHRTFRYGLLVLGSVVTVAPLVVVALAAFFEPGAPIDGVSIPDSWSWGTFSSAWTNGGFADSFRVTLIVAAAVVAIVTVFAVLAAYAMALMRFRGSKALLYVFMAGIVTPYVALVVPIYFQFQALGLLGSYWGLILPEAGLYLGFGVFWMHSFFRSMPPSLVEAARLDGASPFRILWSVYLPVSRPAIVTLMMLTFLSSWNEYLVPLIIGGADGTPTVSLGLASFQGQHLTDIPSLAAASLIVAVPAVALYVLTQRTFFRGLLDGAVK
ncbi:MAG: carbohydrate ABC transporter permease [Nocardioides sp.]|nr:carbohydrate ABC transporter permease [Nocardioides sp.]